MGVTFNKIVKLQRTYVTKTDNLNVIFRGTIVNRGEWLWNPTKFLVLGFCSLFDLDCAKNTIVVYSVPRSEPIETCWLGYSWIVYERKTKDFTRWWTFQTKSCNLCLLLWCLPVFLTNSSVLAMDQQHCWRSHETTYWNWQNKQGPDTCFYGD